KVCLMHSLYLFFNAEDRIRDFRVTGVQTCALPIFTPGRSLRLIISFQMSSGFLICSLQFLKNLPSSSGIRFSFSTLACKASSLVRESPVFKINLLFLSTLKASGRPFSERIYSGL